MNADRTGLPPLVPFLYPRLGPDGASVAINATQLPTLQLMSQHRRLTGGGGVRVATTVSYRAGSSGQAHAQQFTQSLVDGASWLANVYPGASAKDVKASSMPPNPPRPRSPPPSPR